MSDNTILDIENLKVSFLNDSSFLQVLRGVDVKLQKGEILGILGESGSGKTVTASTVMRLSNDGSCRIDSGTIMFDGKDLLGLKEKEMRTIRGKRIAYIFQDASAALNPYKRIGKQLQEVIKVHGEGFSKERIINGMKTVGIDNAQVVYNMYKSQLSGGLCQRVVIAMATMCSPEIIVADEPTTAIDASLQKKVLDLLRDINQNNGSSIIIITHDFDVVKYICRRVVVMYGGLVMEEGSTEEVLSSPLHPYTKELLNCVESLDANDEKLYSLEGKAPTPQEFGEQCPFYDRCKSSNDECATAIPKMQVFGGRKVRCILAKGGDNLEQ